jgi:hypothetical protein
VDELGSWWLAASRRASLGARIDRALSTLAGCVCIITIMHTLFAIQAPLLILTNAWILKMSLERASGARSHMHTREHVSLFSHVSERVDNNEVHT